MADVRKEYQANEAMKAAKQVMTQERLNADAKERRDDILRLREGLETGVPFFLPLPF